MDVRWLLAAAPVYAGALWLRAARWRRILWPELPLGARGTLAPMLVGYAANNVLPARAGELLRALILKRRHGTSRSAAVGTIVVERALDGLVLALFLSGTVAVAGGSGPLRLLAVAGLGAFVVATALLVLLSQSPAWAGRLGLVLGRVAALMPGRARPAAEAIATGAPLGSHHAPRPARLVGGLVADRGLVGARGGDLLARRPRLRAGATGAPLPGHRRRREPRHRRPLDRRRHRPLRVLRARGRRLLRRGGAGRDRLRARAPRPDPRERRARRRRARLAAGARRAGHRAPGAGGAGASRGGRDGGRYTPRRWGM